MSRRADKTPHPPSWKTPHGIALGFVLPLLLLASLLAQRPDDFGTSPPQVALSAALGLVVCSLQLWVGQGDLRWMDKEAPTWLVLPLLAAFLGRLVLSMVGGIMIPAHLNQLGSSEATTTVVDVRSVRTSSKGNNTIARLDPLALKQDASAVVEVTVNKSLRGQLRHGSKLKVTFRQGSLGWPWGTVDEVVQGR